MNLSKNAQALALALLLAAIVVSSMGMPSFNNIPAQAPIPAQFVSSDRPSSIPLSDHLFSLQNDQSYELRVELLTLGEPVNLLAATEAQELGASMDLEATSTTSKQDGFWEFINKDGESFRLDLEGFFYEVDQESTIANFSTSRLDYIVNLLTKRSSSPLSLFLDPNTGILDITAENGVEPTEYQLRVSVFEVIDGTAQEFPVEEQDFTVTVSENRSAADDSEAVGDAGVAAAAVEPLDRSKLLVRPLHETINKKKTRSSKFAISHSTLNSCQQSAIDNVGTEFIFTFLPNILRPFYEVHVAAAEETVVTIEFPMGTPQLNRDVTVRPGTTEIISLRPVQFIVPAANTISDNAIRLSAEKDFVAYAVNRAGFSSDAGMIFPVDALGKEYILAAASPIGSRQQQFAVYAAEDNTAVTITPSTGLTGHAANVPFSINLNRGEVYYTQTSTAGLDGTAVVADKPIGVINGADCAQVPLGRTACDHTFFFARPVEYWGKSAFLTEIEFKPLGNQYTVLAAEDNTTVSLDGTVWRTIDRNAPTTTILAGDHHLEADKPIQVVAYMTGVGFDSSQGAGGDPAAAGIVPPDQYLCSYRFSTVVGGQFSRHALNIVAEETDINNGTLLLNGTPVDPALFTPIGSTGFASANMEIAEGSYVSSSDGKHGIIVTGYNRADSYMYSGGMQALIINGLVDENAPACTATPDAGPPATTTVLLEDNRPNEDSNQDNNLDPSEDLNNNGEIDEDTGISTVDFRNIVNGQFELLDGPLVDGKPRATYRFSAVDDTQIATATVVVTDVAGNETECPITLDLCPNDPNKTVPGVCGCGEPDIDTDGDTTLDCQDGCPLDIEKTDPGVCGCGVKDVDSDGDGTLDCEEEECGLDPTVVLKDGVKTSTQTLGDLGIKSARKLGKISAPHRTREGLGRDAELGRFVTSSEENIRKTLAAIEEHLEQMPEIFRPCPGPQVCSRVDNRDGKRRLTESVIKLNRLTRRITTRLFFFQIVENPDDANGNEVAQKAKKKARKKVAKRRKQIKAEVQVLSALIARIPEIVEVCN